jgi:hypothetical protein
MLAVAAAVLALTAPPFHASVSPIAPELRAYMTGRSWRPGCPVGFSELRLVSARYVGFDGRVRTGRLVVHHTAARPIVRVLTRLYDRRFPIRRLRLVDDYGGSDFRSIEADNTSAFNCRPVKGTTRWSLHAYGLAIDVNPIENPYVTASGRVAHAAGRPYVDRTRIRPGMAYAGGVLVESFRLIGWGWGGTWTGARDYQHFSATGR